MHRTRPSLPTRQIRLFLPAEGEHHPPVALTAPQHRELIRALADLLLRAAGDAGAAAPTGGRDAQR